MLIWSLSLSLLLSPMILVSPPLCVWQIARLSKMGREYGVAKDERTTHSFVKYKRLLYKLGFCVCEIKACGDEKGPMHEEAPSNARGRGESAAKPIDAADRALSAHRMDLPNCARPLLPPLPERLSHLPFFTPRRVLSAIPACTRIFPHRRITNKSDRFLSRQLSFSSFTQCAHPSPENPIHDEAKEPPMQQQQQQQQHPFCCPTSLPPTKKSSLLILIGSFIPG